ARLNQFLAPKEDRSLQIDSDSMASIQNGCKALFHDGPQVKEAFREGYYSRALGFDWYENEKILALTNGSDHTTVTLNDASIASGDEAVTISGGNVTAGSIFTLGLAGTPVYAVHPETKASYSFLRQFVATGAFTNSAVFSPAYISTGAKQNVSNLPVTTDAVTLFGTASLAYKNALAYHKDWATFVTADLPLMDDAAKCVRRVQDGLSLRVWQGSDIRNDELLMRIDILYGYKVLKPDWACRINCT
ncbi:MAG: P22 phage major capsid protein family protein, partial [Nitrospirales bacterium]